MHRERERPTVSVGGFDIFQEWLDPDAQAGLLDAARAVANAAPLITPTTRFGRPMSVRMTSAGEWGWMAAGGQYHYSPTHPDGSPWPPIPGVLFDIWPQITGLERLPDSCLINHYAEGARMGLHQDRDEGSFDWPVLSISLGVMIDQATV